MHTHPAGPKTSLTSIRNMVALLLADLPAPSSGTAAPGEHGQRFAAALAAATVASGAAGEETARQPTAPALDRVRRDELSRTLTDVATMWVKGTQDSTWSPDQAEQLAHAWAPVAAASTGAASTLLQHTAPPLARRLLRPAVNGRPGPARRELITEALSNPRLLTDTDPDAATFVSDLLDELTTHHRAWVKHQLAQRASWTHPLTGSAGTPRTNGQAPAGRAALPWLLRLGYVSARTVGAAASDAALSDEAARVVLSRRDDLSLLSTLAPILLHPDVATNIHLRGRLRRRLDAAPMEHTAVAEARELARLLCDGSDAGLLQPSSRLWRQRLRVELAINGPTLTRLLDVVVGNAQLTRAWVAQLHRTRDLTLGPAHAGTVTQMVSQLTNDELATMLNRRLGTAGVLREVAVQQLISRVDAGDLEALTHLHAADVGRLPARVVRRLPWQRVRDQRQDLLAPVLVEAAARGGAALVNVVLEMEVHWQDPLEDLSGPLLDALSIST